MGIYENIMAYRPCCEQEERDREVMLDYIRRNDDAFLRTNLVAHMTASGWVVNPAERQGADGLPVGSTTPGHGRAAMRTESAICCPSRCGNAARRPVSEMCIRCRGIYISLEVLTVDGHEKRGVYVPSHLHMNVTYLLEADDRDALSVCEEENSGVAWFALDDALKVSTEPWFVERIYKKLNDKLKTMQF